ncbi:MAG: hypothetical protein KDH96_07095 [Candidatus Riesia sp.]|nr:hypothetical protein [Candidatus Riesia sp.]
MPKEQKEKNDEKEEAIKRLERVMVEASVSKGFVAFVGILTDEKDKDGNYIIKYNYERCLFGGEDAIKAAYSMREHVKRDIFNG